MKTKPYKYDFKYRIEESEYGWCVKIRRLLWWSVIKDGLISERAAYFHVEQIETENKEKLRSV